MTDYIVNIDEENKETQLVLAEKLIRCKECKYFSQTTLGMDFACWHGADKVWGETGEHEGHSVCTRIESENHYCGYGERKK